MTKTTGTWQQEPAEAVMEKPELESKGQHAELLDSAAFKEAVTDIARQVVEEAIKAMNEAELRGLNRAKEAMAKRLRPDLSLLFKPLEPGVHYRVEDGVLIKETLAASNIRDAVSTAPSEDGE